MPLSTSPEPAVASMALPVGLIQVRELRRVMTLPAPFKIEMAPV